MWIFKKSAKTKKYQPPCRCICRAELAPGVKLNHGIFNAIENQIAVHCLPKNLPEFIEADVSHLQIGGSIHLGEIAPPSGVRFDELCAVMTRRWRLFRKRRRLWKKR